MSKVVLVEDDAWLAELEAGVLTDAGHTVVVVSNATAAIEKIDAVLPDVIIVDMLLAGSTAFVLLHELQSYSDTATIPIVVCSTIADQFDVEQLATYGVRRIIDKNVMQPGDLVAAVIAVTMPATEATMTAGKGST